MYRARCAQQGWMCFVQKLRREQYTRDQGNLPEARRLFVMADSMRKMGDPAARFFNERIDAGEQFPRAQSS